MKQTIKTGFAALVLLLAISCKKESNSLQSLPVTDKSSSEALSAGIDGAAAIPSITIGTQVWMTKNLTVSRYRNGDKIPQVKNAAAWAALTTGAWCYYSNDTTTGAIYGKLYNWYAVNDPRGLAPAGWHVPSDAEWTTLTTFLGGESVAGGKMKSTGTIEAGTGLWYSPNTDATNSSGFTGLPGGHRYGNGTFFNIGYDGYWWSSTKVRTSGAWSRYLYYNFGDVYRLSGSNKQEGYSVRCLKD